ncbi:MAG TPA: (p)ppGpp synthetase, partial [Firmicutes bacterium]|nr:(p)ppGpp synthetase [Bacillota bacterium]
MSLAELKYIERALLTLDEQENHLNMMSRLLEMEFRQIVEINEVDYLNIMSRVKGRDSLKEKILRQGYYKKYHDPIRLIYHLSDLIGIRIECRFEEDEKLIYRMLKKHFNVCGEDGYYYNEMNPNVRLALEGRQPQKQKNGFKIYRLDGLMLNSDEDIPFELQIKSLVNAFWGEIEHKIIYKNYNFMLSDSLLVDMLGSIKNNLALLDKQLLTIYRNVEQRNNSEMFQQQQLETMMAKMCNDIFSKQIKQSIGMNVNIKKASQTIMNYTFEAKRRNSETEQGEILISALQRLTDISNQTIEFNTPIVFERQPTFSTPFSSKLGTYMQEVMNKEFHW